MTGLMELAVPIVLSAVLVFVASSIIHMASPWHKNDFPRLPNEDAVMNALRPLNIPPGDYMMPRPQSREEMRSPEFAAKVQRGPVVVFTMFPSGPMSMARNFVGWIVYVLVVSLFAGYVTSRALGPAAESAQVFRFSATTAFLGYVLALWQLTIWYRRSLNITIKSTVDGLLYAVVTAATFVWLWPR